VSFQSFVRIRRPSLRHGAVQNQPVCDTFATTKRFPDKVIAFAEEVRIDRFRRAGRDPPKRCAHGSENGNRADLLSKSQIRIVDQKAFSHREESGSTREEICFFYRRGLSRALDGRENGSATAADRSRLTARSRSADVTVRATDLSGRTGRPPIRSRWRICGWVRRTNTCFVRDFRAVPP